jgi:hypothetical protein
MCVLSWVSMKRISPTTLSYWLCLKKWIWSSLLKRVRARPMGLWNSGALTSLIPFLQRMCN